MKEKGMHWSKVKGAVSHVIGIRSWCGGTNVLNALVGPQTSLLRISEIKKGREERKNALLVERDSRSGICHV
jgi:hypothetical protein